MKIRKLPTLLIPALLASGCATTPPGEPREPGEEEAPVRVGSAPAGPISSSLTEEVLYKVLVAEIAGQRGRIDLALENYIELAGEIDDPQVAERATRIAVFARDNERALEMARRWVALDPANLDARQIMAAMNIRLGNVDQALSDLEYVLNADEEAAGQKLRMIANFLSREEDKQTALVVMERLVSERQDDVDALFAYALLAIRLEDLDKAREVMERVVAHAPDNISVAMAYLSVLQKQEETQTAIDWLQEALELHPDQDDLRLMYARILADAKRFDESREQFAILAEKSPQNADVRYALALLYLQANDLDAAATHLQMLVELGERVNEAAFYLGQIAQTRKHYDEALRWFRMVEGGANHFDAQLHIGLVLARQTDVEGARTHLHGIAAKDREEQVRIIRAEGEILAEHGLLDEAMAVYGRALEEEYDTELLYTRAMLAEKMDRLDLLEQDLRAILEREPDNAQALNALGYTLADRTDRHHEAFELISRALELSPEDFYILDSMGWVLYRLGRLEEAVDYLRKAREIRDDPEVAAHLGEVLWVMGQKDAARDVWESALEATPDDEKLLEVIKRLTP
jgi:tetratricopeptide (TPR) repeat protein